MENSADDVIRRPNKEDALSDENVLIKQVYITASEVKQKETRLSKGNNESIIWHSEIDGTITFGVSPFIKGRVFALKTNGVTPSGGVDPTAPIGMYVYTVEDEDGNEIDPRVFIDK